MIKASWGMFCQSVALFASGTFAFPFTSVAKESNNSSWSCDGASDRRSSLTDNTHSSSDECVCFADNS
uniref:Putative secreted protein n=1 Tax=Anopheles darlingi TaxID=43151 RepID=A0A2M4DR61_ANODA